MVGYNIWARSLRHACLACVQGEKWPQQGLESHFWSCQIIRLDHVIWLRESDESESQGVYLDVSYVESIYVIIWGVGMSISWPFHVHRFGGFFGGGMPSFIEPQLPIYGIGMKSMNETGVI